MKVLSCVKSIEKQTKNANSSVCVHSHCLSTYCMFLLLYRSVVWVIQDVYTVTQTHEFIGSFICAGGYTFCLSAAASVGYCLMFFLILAIQFVSYTHCKHHLVHVSSFSCTSPSHLWFCPTVVSNYTPTPLFVLKHGSALVQLVPVYPAAMIILLSRLLILTFQLCTTANSKLSQTSRITCANLLMSCFICMDILMRNIH